ncbi:MAG: FAD-dependent oxidoreductase [Eubacterium sp.]|nr:FAD-dependent oxidoreductase [Eubacterium sp.]
MLRITQLKLPVTHTRDDLEEAIRKKAGGRKPDSWRIVRRSIDARKKPVLYYIYTIDAAFSNEKKLLHIKKSSWSKVEEITYRFPYRIPPGGDSGLLPEVKRPVIVGAGPAGLFAALVLARNGFRPILFERGDEVTVRSAKVESFWKDNVLDPESNVQFGEGGAGTFSDGKLNTLVKDKFGRNRFVLEEFVRHGAPEEIRYDAKPHIGTNVLKEVVASIREEIRSLGGQVHFRTKVVGIVTNDGQDKYKSRQEMSLSESHTARLTDPDKRRIIALRIEQDGRAREWPCQNVILAIGHSARDTFFMLDRTGLNMHAKAFAMGVRVEHPADMINESQYGKGYPDNLSAASYKLTHQCSNGRGIYSFCMCPGGYVVNSSSEPERLCINGMSYHGRDGRNSNSAIITTVGPEDYPGIGPLAGIEFQRKYEELAWQAGSGRIPVQLLGDFREGRITTGFGAYTPAVKGSFQLADLRSCLPDYICQSLLEGMTAFGKKIRGYDREDTILLGVEARTSSPVRIERDESGQGSISGIFPCGEGAGYAGGITSAAMDGLKAAEMLAAKMCESI